MKYIDFCVAKFMGSKKKRKKMYMGEDIGVRIMGNG